MKARLNNTPVHGPRLVLRVLLLAGLCCGIAPLPAQDEPLPLENPGFEDDLEGWRTPGATDENVRVTAEAASTGEKGLHLKDTDSSPGFKVFSTPVSIEPNMAYKVTFQGMSVGTPGGVGVEMVFRGHGGETLRPVNIPRAWPAVTINALSVFNGHTLKAIAPEGAAELQIVITSWSGPGAEVMVDDFAIRPIPEEARIPES